MDAMTLVREDAVGEARVEDAWRERRPGRCRMFKPAQIAFDGLVLDCVLLDASPEGAQVHLKAPADVPDLVSLRFPGGESRTMRRCWQRGARIGFEVVGTAPLIRGYA